MIRQPQLPSGNGIAEYDAFAGAEPAGRPPDESPVDLFMKLHRMLRGRYILALTLGAIGAMAGAVGGYLATEPKWQSMAGIRVEPMGKVVLGTTETTFLPMFDSYVRDQIGYLEQDETITRAMMSDEWRSLGRGVDSTAKRQFRKSLSINVDRDNRTWINVRFVDKDPEAPRIAVKHLVDSYKVLFGSKILLSNKEAIQLLDAEKLRYETEIKDRDNRITKIGEPFGTIELTQVHADTLRDLRQAQEQVDILDQQIIHARAEAAANPPAPNKPAEGPRKLDVMQEAAEIAKVDKQMDLLLQKRQVEYNEKLRLELKWAPDAPKVLDAIDRVKALDRQINEYRDQWMAAHNNMLPRIEGPGAPILAGSIEVMEATRKSYADLATKKHEKAIQITIARQEIEQFQQDIKGKREELDRVKNRLNLLSLENASQSNDSGVIGRVQIVSDGDEPSMFSDSRKKLAALGFLLGGSFPILGVLLLGSLDHRFRYSDDAQSGESSVPLLGILPYLPDTLKDPEQAGIAAHCVHQIRTHLQISGVERDRTVFAVTSATSGDGKTSLCMSLGLSFAASGSNTCLIDFDMIGGGLTAAMGARTDVGLLAAIDDGQLDGHIRPTAFPRLSLIPAGRDDAQEISRLSPRLVRRLIEQARKEFDVVVVDTGPILGSIEATLVCGVADGVVLALGRGQQRAMAKRAIDSLRSVGAHLMGVVFNRAQANDFKRTVSQSVRSIPMHDSGGELALKALPAMGPMARTVVSHTRSDS